MDTALVARLLELERRVADAVRAEIPTGGRLTMAKRAPAISNATNATPIVVTAASHAMATGERVYIGGVVGNTAANGYWTVTVTGANTFSLDGSRGNGAYVSGGTIDRLFPVIPSTLATFSSSLLFLVPYLGEAPLLSLDVSALDPGVYDVFVGLSGLSATAWSSTTVRSTPLRWYRGRLVSSSSINDLYRGTVYLSTKGTLEWSAQTIPIWNYYNRVRLSARAQDTAAHGYTTAAWREWNGADAYRVSYVCGVDEEALSGKLKAAMTGNCRITPALDTVAASYANYASVIGDGSYSFWAGSGIGYHFYTCAEYGAGSGSFSRLDLSISLNG